MVPQLQRYADAQYILKEVQRLRIVRKHVTESYLENLERTRLVVPKLRIRYPDTIARRLWVDAHPEVGAMTVEVEPDGPRLNAATDFEHAIRRHRVNGRQPHPLDDLDPRFAEFVYRSSERAFLPWSEFRVEVSNETYETLYDTHYVTTLYSSWQVLQIAEMAEMGIHILVNLAEDGKFEAAVFAGQDVHKLPPGCVSVQSTSIPLLRDFATHKAALDAVVWFAEESDEALRTITFKRSGRYILSDDEGAAYRAGQQAAARTACDRYRVSGEQLIELAKFLGDRWRSWDRDGRPLIADEYRRYLGKAVLLAQLGAGMDFETVRTGMGFSWGKTFLLDDAFPDWAELEKNRVRDTLGAMIRHPDANITGLGEAEIDAFVEFVDKEGLHAFFWRVRSFEDHVNLGNNFALEGMRSDLQGMAVVVEHVARALAGEQAKGEIQLYKVFHNLWKGSEVADILGKAAKLTKPPKKYGPTDWSKLKADLEDLAQSSPAAKIASYLVMAHRVRGAVHYKFQEENQFELERLFVELMLAAVLTFSHVRGPF